MRGATFLLLLSLLAPSVATAVCELTCVHVHQHEPVVSTESCHHETAAIATETAPLQTLERQVTCHETNGRVAAVVLIGPSWTASPADQAQGALSLGFRAKPAGLSAPETCTPPAISHNSTQLRI